jgi:hypothetical protein
MRTQKNWIDYRFEEMEEKAGVSQLPEYDMDGSRFIIDDDNWETNERDDAYIMSISKRLANFSLYYF